MEHSNENTDLIHSDISAMWRIQQGKCSSLLFVGYCRMVTDGLLHGCKNGRRRVDAERQGNADSIHSITDV